MRINAPDIGRPSSRPGVQGESSEVSILAIGPELLGLDFVFGKLEVAAPVLFDDLLDNLSRLCERRWSWALELEEQAVLFGPLALGHAELIGRFHEDLVNEFHALDTDALVHDLDNRFGRVFDAGELDNGNVGGEERGKSDSS